MIKAVDEKKKKTGDVTTISGERVVLARRPFWKDIVWVETWKRSYPCKQLKEEQAMQGKQQVQTPWGRKAAGVFRKEAGGAEAISSVGGGWRGGSHRVLYVIKSSFNFIPLYQEAMKCSARAVMWSNLHVYKFPLADSWNAKNIFRGSKYEKRETGKEVHVDNDGDLDVKVEEEGFRETQGEFWKWN